MYVRYVYVRYVKEAEANLHLVRGRRERDESVCNIGERGGSKLTFGGRRPGASPGGAKKRVIGNVGELVDL